MHAVLEPVADVERAAVRAQDRRHGGVPGRIGRRDPVLGKIHDTDPAVRRGAGHKQFGLVGRQGQSQRGLGHRD